MLSGASETSSFDDYNHWRARNGARQNHESESRTQKHKSEAGVRTEEAVRCEGFWDPNLWPPALPEALHAAGTGSTTLGWEVTMIRTTC